MTASMGHLFVDIGFCAPLLALCDTFLVITSAVSFQCGFCVTVFLFVCFVCSPKIFVPSVSSLQSLTLGTRVLLCGLSEQVMSPALQDH